MALERGDRPTPSPNRKGNTVAETKVRTSINPGEVIEVSDAELLDLTRQGLIHSREGDEAWQDDEPVEVESGVITDGLTEQAEGGDESRLAENTETGDTEGKPEVAPVTDEPIEPLAARVKRASKASAQGETEGGN